MVCNPGHHLPQPRSLPTLAPLPRPVWTLLPMSPFPFLSLKELLSYSVQEWFQKARQLSQPYWFLLMYPSEGPVSPLALRYTSDDDSGDHLLLLLPLEDRDRDLLWPHLGSGFLNLLSELSQRPSSCVRSYILSCLDWTPTTLHVCQH